MHHPTDRTVHTMAFVTAVVEHWSTQLYLYQHTAETIRVTLRQRSKPDCTSQGAYTTGPCPDTNHSDISGAYLSHGYFRCTVKPHCSIHTYEPLQSLQIYLGSNCLYLNGPFYTICHRSTPSAITSTDTILLCFVQDSGLVVIYDREVDIKDLPYKSSLSVI